MVEKSTTPFLFCSIVDLSVKNVDFISILRLVENFYKEFLDFFVRLCENKVARNKTRRRGCILANLKGNKIWIKNQWELFLPI